MQTSWSSNSYYTYVVLNKNSNHDEVSNKITDFLAEQDPGYFVQLHLQKISDMHLKSNYTADWGGHGNILYVKIFSIIAGFILVIACINFINLSLSQSPLRAKEIGIRKVLGANRNMLVYQYLGESLILTLIAMLIGIVFVELLLPSFNSLTGKALSINLLQDPVMFAGLIAIALFTGIFAGSYPAFVLSGYQPVKTLKGKLSNTRSGIKLRQFLVVMQFTLAVGLIISTIIISKQINLIKNIDLGYQKDHIVIFNTRGEVNSDFLSFKEEILKIPGVESVTTSSINPVNIVSSGYGLTWKGMPEEEERQHLIHTIRVSYDFFKTFNIKFKEGRSFSNEHSSDSLNYICNSKLLELIGEEGRLGMELAYYREEYGNLIGIIEDFHFKSLFKEIEPLLISLEDASNLTDAYIRINPNGISNTLKSIEEVWKQYESHSPLEYTFLDESYDKLYKSEFRMEKIFRFFAVLAIFISCLGLFGLVSYSSTCRIKEMGIRKVYGATAQDIIGLLLSKFGILILISNILAWLPTWYLMNNWLQNFAFRIDISFTSFLAATVLTSGIAFITTSYHAIKAAVSNPMESLHYE